MTSTNRPLPSHDVVPAVWARYGDLDIDHGEGSWLVNREGERYLDYTSGIGVANTGHAHPRVAAAIGEQASKLIHGQQNILFHEPGLRLYERLTTILRPVEATFHPGESLRETMGRIEAWILRQALASNGGQRTSTARLLGITREGLYN